MSRLLVVAQDGQQRPAVFWQPPKRRRGRWQLVVAPLAVVLVGAVVTFFVIAGDNTPATSPTVGKDSRSSPSGTTASRGPAPRGSSAVSPASATTESPTSQAAGPVELPADLDACVASIFAADTFSSQPNMSFACKRTDPRKGAVDLEARLVHVQASRGVTDAMKEWSILGWYEMAAFALARARCCRDVEPLVTRVGHNCKFDEALNELGRVAAHEDKVALEGALDRFDTAVRCLINFRLARFYDHDELLHGPERAAFVRMVDRVRGR